MIGKAVPLSIFGAFCCVALSQAFPQNVVRNGQRILEGGFVPVRGNNRDAVRFPDDVVRPVGRNRNNRPPPQGPVQPVRVATLNSPSNSRRPQSPRSSNRQFQEAIRPAHLFVRPSFDVFGNTIDFDTFNPIVDDSEQLPDFRRPVPSRKPAAERPPGPNLGPDLQVKLPVFGQPDLILQATEELRNRDVNQEIIVPTGAVNAGVLPLAFETDSALGLFPPLAPLKKTK